MKDIDGIEPGISAPAAHWDEIETRLDEQALKVALFLPHQRKY
jgi:hypothetical protein